MSEALGRLVEEDLDRRDRFVRDNMRRMFLMIYRIVGNVADAQDLAQAALQRRSPDSHCDSLQVPA